MDTLLIGDCHFGVRTNSQTWLRQQTEFFTDTVTARLSHGDINKVVVLGDLFDVRYAINGLVGVTVKDMLRALCDGFPDVKFCILAGNHDYYTPNEEDMHVNAYETVFGYEFTDVHRNLKLVTREPWLDMEDGSLMLPWYWTENSEHFDELLYRYRMNEDVKCIYAHADLTVWPGGRIAALKHVPVYSGHIHYIVDDTFTNLHNVGAAFALTFADINQERYIYILDGQDFHVKERIANHTTPRFIRLFNDEIFTAPEDAFRNTYVQICLSAQNTIKAKFKERVRELKTKYLESDIRVHIVDREQDMDVVSAEGFNTDIDRYIEDNIPENLDSKYRMIHDRIAGKS